LIIVGSSVIRIGAAAPALVTARLKMSTMV